METLRSFRLIAKLGDHSVSFDLKDGFYSLAIDPKYREAFTVNLDGQLLQFCALPMGWSLSPFVFQKRTEVFTDYLRDPQSSTPSLSDPSTTVTRMGPKALKRWRRRRRRLTGARLLPFVDVFAMLEDSYDKTLALATTVFAQLASFFTKGAPSQGALSSHSSWGPSRHDHELRKSRVSSPYGEAKRHRSYGEGAALQSSLPQAMGER